MSINRKKRLRKLTSAMLGALGMAGSAANLDTNAHQEMSTLTKAGIGTGMISGLALATLATYNTFKDKTDPEEKELRKMQLKNEKEKIEEEEKKREKIRKREEIKQKYNLSDAEMNNVTAVINTHLRGAGKPNLSADEILSAISGMQNEEKILANAKVANAAATSYWINREIANELTIDKLNKSLDALRELPEGVAGESMLTTVQLTDAARGGRKILPQISNAQKNYNNAIPNVLGQGIFGSLSAVTKNQIAAADALMPENVKTLVGGCWGVSPVCPTLGKSVAIAASTAYGGLYTSTVLTGVGANNHAGYRAFTLVGWNGTGAHVYESSRMAGTFLDGRDGRLGMDLILGPDCNSNTLAHNTNSWGMGLGTGNTKDILKKLNKADLKKLNASIFKTVYEFTR